MKRGSSASSRWAIWRPKWVIGESPARPFGKFPNRPRLADENSNGEFEASGSASINKDIIMAKSEIRTGEASLVKGFAWHVYPDPATPGAHAGESPFAGGRDLPGPERSPLEPPPDITTFWTVERGEASELLNQVEERAYLVVTEAPVAPDVKTGWNVEPAQLED